MALTDKLRDIADAIRGKTGKTDTLTLDQMAMEIAGLKTGGGAIVPGWVAKSYDITIGENTVTNTLDTKAYFENAVGSNAFLLFCKDEVDTYNQIVMYCFVYKTSMVRYRNGAVGIANVAANYDAVLPVGSIYTVWEV